VKEWLSSEDSHSRDGEGAWQGALLQVGPESDSGDTNLEVLEPKEKGEDMNIKTMDQTDVHDPGNFEAVLNVGKKGGSRKRRRGSAKKKEDTSGRDKSSA